MRGTGAQTVRVQKPRDSFADPGGISSSCYSATARRLNYLKEPDIWDSAAGNLGLRH